MLVDIRDVGKFLRFYDLIVHLLAFIRDQALCNDLEDVTIRLFADNRLSCLLISFDVYFNDFNNLKIEYDIAF